MTNADRIRQMTDEELAEWFAPHMMCNICDKNNKPCGCNRNECKKVCACVHEAGGKDR